LAYIAPNLREGEDDTLWLSLLDGLAKVAGHRGAINLIAEVNDDSPVVDILRQANFGVYARQELWVRPAQPTIGHVEPVLRPAEDVDEIAMQVLYSELLPGLIRQVEPLAIDADAVYVMDYDHGHIGAMVLEHRGVKKTLLECFVHPDMAEAAYPVVIHALELAHGDERPVYCRLRSRVAALGAGLIEAGFEPITSQALMVRHTASRMRYRATEKRPVVDGIFATTNQIRDKRHNS
jgi:hypothetical protein